MRAWRDAAAQAAVEYKFHNAVWRERCSPVASRLFKAAGTPASPPTCRSGGFLMTSPSPPAHLQSVRGRPAELRRVPVGIENNRILCSSPAEKNPGRHSGARCSANPESEKQGIPMFLVPGPPLRASRNDAESRLAKIGQKIGLCPRWNLRHAPGDAQGARWK